MHRLAIAVDDTDPATALLFTRTTKAGRAMCTSKDMSGAPPKTRQTATHALAKRGGVVLADNDNIHRTLRSVDGHGLDRHEYQTAVHGLGHPQQVGEPASVREQREQLGVLGLGLEVLRGALQLERLLRRLGGRAGIGMLTAFDLNGETRRKDRERARSAAAGTAKGQ